ncbi:TPA: chaperone protein [Methanosarcinaceae archaeon]|nr:chaperone protein [Methanosarcinaceae archaeon]
MSKDAILRLQKTSLFKKLREIEEKEVKETSLEDNEVSQNIFSVVCKAAPLLERVPENMPEFTLHNANHSIHVIENIERIVPYEILEQLNAIEISILIYAAYLHDIGMTASPDERKHIIETDSEFKKLLTSKEELYQKLEVAKSQGDNQTASNIENKIFTDFLRRNHVQRTHKIIKEYEFDSKISWRGISYCKWVTAVCDSHGLPVEDLYNIKSWPNNTFVLDKPVNVQYLAIIFRLADILDIDPERTPKHLFYYINPKDEVSINEWRKHLSITGFQITPEKVKIVADCEHPEQERTLREFIKTIDKELEDSYRLVSSYRDSLEKNYILKLSEPINIDIHSSGYEYSDFRFELDYRRVLDLLMGEGLYGDPVVALRELLQNSVDAVRYRESLEKREGNGYTPCIEVSLKNNELTIEDNGIGMDEKIFENYFMKVGRSYYQSIEFRQKKVDVDPVSEFGIGILSVFMVADKFTVESRRKTFEDEMTPPEPIYFEIPTAYDYFVKKASKRTKHGTKITLCLKPNHPFSAKKIFNKISELAPFIEYPIVVYTADGKETYKPFLPGEMPENRKSIKEYFEVRLDDLDKFEGIKGVLKLVQKSTKISWLVAQRGFSIPYHSRRGLLHHANVSINISGQAKLTLSPSRFSLIMDEKWDKLTNKLQSKLSNEFERNLKHYKKTNGLVQYSQYVNELLDEWILDLEKDNALSGNPYKDDEINESMKRIFLNHVPLLTASENGEISYKVISDLDKLPTVAITASSGWPEEIPETKIIEETRKLIGPRPVLIFDEQKGHFSRSDFFHYIMGEPSQMYITSIPGVVISIFSNNEDKSSSLINEEYSFISKIHDVTGNSKPLFVHSLENDLPYNVIFNTNHWLLSRFFNEQQPKDELSSKAIKLLTNNIMPALESVWNTAHSDYYIIKSGMRSNFYINYKLIGITKYYPEIIEEFHEATTKFWEEAQSIGAIPLEEEFPGFTSDDLPWFWNHKLE